MIEPRAEFATKARADERLVVEDKAARTEALHEMANKRLAEALEVGMHSDRPAHARGADHAFGQLSTAL